MVERVSDFKMPEKVVTKLLRDALPDNVIVSKDAKNAACRSASIFILQLSIAAAEKAQNNNRRHLENQDIIKAVTDLGLGEYAPQLVRFGAQRKRNARRKESSILKSKAGRKAAAHGANVNRHDMDDNGRETSDQQDTPEPSFDSNELDADSHDMNSQDEEDSQMDD